MTLKLHRPDGEGGLEPRPVVEPDWRTQLQSPRWGTALEGDRLPEPEEPGDEPDLADAVGPLLAWPSAWPRSC